MAIKSKFYKITLYYLSLHFKQLLVTLKSNLYLKSK